MNRAGLNTVVLNAAPLDPIQRAVVHMYAVASAVVQSRKLALAKIISAPVATITLKGRAFIRGAAAVEAIGSVVLIGYNRFYASIAAQARALVVAAGTAYPKEYIYAPLTAYAKAVLWPDSVVLRRQPQSYVGRATASISYASSFSKVLGRASVVAKALPHWDFSTYKRLPYDEDATDDRTMVVSADDRTMTVA